MTRKPKLARMGRPPLPPEKRKRPSMGFRPTAKLRKKIEDAASVSGLSLTQEVERRLEQSFLKEDADDRVRQATIKGVEDSFGGYETFMLMRFAAVAIGTIEEVTDKSWRSDPETFTHVRDAITQMLTVMMAMLPSTRMSAGGVEYPGLGQFAGQRAGEITRDELQRYRTELVRALSDFAEDKGSPPTETPDG